MKPHSMMFDEAYNETYYQSDSVINYVNDQCDGFIVIGTALETALAVNLVKTLIQKNTVPIVEVNLEQNIMAGYVLVLKQKSE